MGYLDVYNNNYFQMYISGKKGTYIKNINNKIILTVSVGWEYSHVGSLQFGQFLHRIFFVATLLDNTSFCSSGLIFSKACFSNNFLFCSSVNSCFSPSPTWAFDSFFVEDFCEGKIFLLL